MKLMKKVVAAVLTLVMIAAVMMFAPTTADAAEATPGFDVEVSVADETDGEHIGGIRVPEMVIKFTLVPEVTNLPEDNRYNAERENFPNGNQVSDTKVIEYDYTMNAFTSNSYGKDPAGALVKLQDIPKLKSGVATWGEKSKVYRYHLNMVGIYMTNGSGSPDTGTNYLNTGSIVTAPESTELLMDIYVDSTGEIHSNVLWDSTGSDKVTGFSAPSSMGRAAKPAGASGITYNVYDVEVSTDYVGLASNNVEGKVMYSVMFENLPEYLTNYHNDSDYIKSAITYRNKDSWVDTSTALASNKASFKGALAANDKIIFAGMPYEGADGNPIKFSASIDYKNVTDLAGVDAKDQYKDSIYFGADTERIDGSITSLDDFIKTAYSKDYDYSEGTGYVKSTPSTIMVKGSSTSDNNARFIVFDPSELVIVGVTVNALPGVIAIAAAAVGIAAFVVVRKQSRARY